MKKITDKTAKKTTKSVERSKKTVTKRIDKIRITFVCTGNTCRSAMAELIFKDEIKRRGVKDKFIINSFGLHVVDGDEINEKAIEALKVLGYKVSKHKAKQLTPEVAKKADLIVCMTTRHKNTIGLNNAYTVGDIVGKGDIIDPYGAPVSEYIRTAECLIYSVDKTLKLAENLAKNRTTQQANQTEVKTSKRS